MNGQFGLLEELTKRYGAVKRARGCFLYTQSGTRITDLWLDGGRAVLGWGAGKSRLYFKNSIDRGFFGIYGSKLPQALEKALRSICGEFAFFAFYTDKAKVQAALSCAGLRADKPPLYFPWLDYGLNLPPLPHAKIKKPALYCTDDSLKNEPALKAEAGCVEIVLPFSWQPASVLAFRDAALQQKVPESDGMPAPLCEALCRAVYDLRLALPARAAGDWALFDKEIAPYWHRIGPYLKYKGSKESYSAFFMHCLEQKLLISPSYDAFSVVPFGADTGVFYLLKNNPYLHQA